MPSRKKPAKRARGVPKIKELHVCGYKSIVDPLKLELRNLTVIAGSNSSGKSSALQPLLLLKQTIESSYETSALRLDGPLVKFSSSAEMFAKLNMRQQADEITIGIAIDAMLIESKFNRDKSGAINLASTTYNWPNNKVRLTSNLSHRNLLEQIPDFSSLEKSNGSSKSELIVGKQRCFHFVGLKNHYSKNESFTLPIAPFVPFPALNAIAHAIYLPGLRGTPDRTYLITSDKMPFSGVFQNYIASILLHWQHNEPAKLLAIGEDLKRLGLTAGLKVTKVSETHASITVNRLFNPPRNSKVFDEINIADVGLGVSQCLPVLVALHLAAPGQLVIIEQPEIHLHPKAQTVMANILVDAAKRGVIVVTETHSSMMCIAIQTLVAEKEILPKDVKFHWFWRDNKSHTKFESSDVDSFGATKNWPSDFGETELEAQARYLDVIDRLRRHVK